MTQLNSSLTRRRLLTRAAQAATLLISAGARARLATAAAPPKISRALADTRTKGLGVWDVSAYGYVAEEYFLSGTADVLKPVCMADVWKIESRDMTADFAAREFTSQVLRRAVAYTTRLIVYKPRDPARFSGTAVMETLHPNDGGTGLVWNAIHRYFLSRGDAYIGVQHPVTIAGLRGADAARYGSLSVVDPTQLWGMLKHAGSLMKSTARDSPLYNYPLRHLVMTGYSYTGVATASFANYHHAESVLDDGRSVFDAYVPIADSQYVRPLSVPVIRLNTQSDFDSYGGLRNRRPDDERYRHYEVAGASHAAIATPADAATFPSKGKLSTPQGQPTTSPERCLEEFPAGSHLNDFPLYLVEEAVFERMFEWLAGGTPPPPSLLIETDDAGQLRADRWGNALGGVRYPQLSVPTARYGVGSKGICLLYGYTVPFDAATCRRLYGSFARYQSLVEAAAQELVKARMLRGASMQELVAIASGNRPF